MPYNTLDDLVSPHTWKQFLYSYLGHTFLHLPGAKNRFAHLLSWETLNQVLERHAPDPSKIALYKEGQVLQADKYLTPRTGNAARLMVGELTAALRSGATLIINNVHEKSTRLSELSYSLERILRTPTQMNLYATWRTSPGFGLHWDNHDVFVLQLYGGKRWEIYGETVRSPLGRCDGSSPTNTTPLWTGILASGDVLYIPRGWWHIAYPLDEPTMHLTIGFRNATSMDLLEWLAGSLTQYQEIRADVPLFCEESASAEYLESLRVILSNALLDRHLLERFFQSRDLTAAPRQSFGLPWSATPEILPPNPEEYIVNLVSSRGLVSNTTSEEDSRLPTPAQISHHRYNSEHLTLVRYLNEYAPVLVADARQALSSSYDHLHFVEAVRALVADGVISLSKISQKE